MATFSVRNKEICDMYIIEMLNQSQVISEGAGTTGALRAAAIQRYHAFTD